MLAGPYCTYLLGLLGAEIIKVEIPGGEMGRWMAPPGPPRDAGLGAAFLAQAAGTRMLAVDIRKPEGAEILRRLLRNADVFVEGLRPGAVARAGFDEASLRALNPRLVFASVSGFAIRRAAGGAGVSASRVAIIAAGSVASDWAVKSRRSAQNSAARIVSPAPRRANRRQRRNSSLVTRRWREMDSNHRSLTTRRGFRHGKYR